MNYFSEKRLVIHPGDKNDLEYWTQRWGVSVKHIYDAILETGSTRIEDVRNALRKKKLLGTLSSWFYRLINNGVVLYF